MGDSHPPTITSFVIRFVVDEDLPHSAAERAPEAASYRGLIRHVQSDQTLNFHLWDEAVEFIRRFVPLESAIQECSTCECRTRLCS
jgi:hypothetical protein